MSYYNEPKRNPEPEQSVLATVGFGAGAVVVVLLVIAAIIAASVGGCTVIRNWNRAQARANARNKVAITHILIQNAEQQARVVRAQNRIVQARAQQRFLESIGIRRAQDEIRRTLTPLYVQHEAIQAEEDIARSGRNNTVIYVPAGANGVPLVNTVAQGAVHR